MLGSLGREHQQCRRFLTSPGWVWPVWLCSSALPAGHHPGLIISIQRWSRRCSSGSPSPTSSTGTSSSLSSSTLTTSSTSFTGISSSASTRWGTGWSSQLMELFQRFVWSRKLNIFASWWRQQHLLQIMSPLIHKLVRKHISMVVKDPSTAKKLTPTYDMGCKRITPSGNIFWKWF